MEAGIIEEVVGRLLNHTPLSITGHRYVRPSLDALRPAIETICTALARRSNTPLTDAASTEDAPVQN